MENKNKINVNQVNQAENRKIKVQMAQKYTQKLNINKQINKWTNK